MKEVEGVALEFPVADRGVYSFVGVRSYEQIRAASFSQYRRGVLLQVVSSRSILACMGAVPDLFSGPSEGCRPRFLISDFALEGDMMIGNEGTGGRSLYCRCCAVLWCYEDADRSVMVGRQ